MKKIFSIIASAMLIASCTSQTEELVDPIPENQEPEGQTVTLCASIATGDDASHAPQRVSGKDSNPGSTTGVINLTWDAGDKVLVKVGEESAVFTLSSGAGTNMGSFTGVMPGDGSSYDVVYPADYNEEVLAEQTYVENGFGNGLMKMSTNTPGNLEDGFVMSADNALLGLQLTGNDELGKIVLTNPADSKTYTLTCTGVKLTSEAKMFYIVVPAGEWANGFNVSVYASDDTTLKTMLKGSSVTFAASKAMVMPIQDAATIKTIDFSVAADKKLIFSPGNLQYHPKNNQWRFAENQYDRIGAANKNISADYDGWLDLFGWSTAKTNFGLSVNYYDYQEGDFIDWGSNPIGGAPAGTWRTMTKDEWDYLLDTRPNASSLQGVAQVNGVNGLILLPDSWTCPTGISFTPGYDGAAYNEQSFTTDEWLKLEEAGAIFLPAAGYRDYDYISLCNSMGYYWSATKMNDDYAYSLNLAYYLATTEYPNACKHGQSVRLVKDL